MLHVRNALRGVEIFVLQQNIGACAVPHKTPRPRRIANALNWNVSASLMLGQIFVR